MKPVAVELKEKEYTVFQVHCLRCDYEYFLALLHPYLADLCPMCGQLNVLEKIYKRESTTDS